MIVGSALNKYKSKTKFECEIENLITNDIRDRIIFTGFVDYSEIYKYYKIADIVILPSIIEDSAPLTIIEALSCGVPIITTDSGGIPEYAVNNSAIILPRNDELVYNITKSIDKLLNDENLINQLSYQTKMVSKELTSAKFYQNFIDIMIKSNGREKKL